MKLKQVVATALAAAMITTSFAGCGSKKENDTKDAGNSASSGDVKTTKTSDGFELPITAKPTTFTIFLNFNNMPFNPEWRIWKEISKLTNINLKSVISQSNSKEDEAFNLMASSGKLADIIGYVSPSDLEKLGRNGGMIPLNDLIKKYAPHIQSMLDTDPQFRQAAVSMDGKIYQIPKNTKLHTAEEWWIRQDWLDKLKLKAPTNVDEMYKVLTAFRNDDPNGNGKKDEIPLFDRAGHKMPDEYLYLWDTSLGFYPRNGKMTFEPLEPNFKVGVKNITKWYKERLIDPEIFTRGPKSRDILLSGNLGGCTHDWPSTGNYNNSLKKSIPGFKMTAIAPPADQNGVVKERTDRRPTVGWGISSKCKDPATVMKFFDFFFTQEGSDLVNWGIEGETYTKNSKGEKQYTDAVLKSDKTPVGYLRSLGVQYRIGMCQDPAYEFAFMTPAAKDASKLYTDHKEWYDTKTPPYVDGQLNLKYEPQDEAKYKKIMSSITPYVAKEFQSWMLGTSNFDKDYNGFVAELKSRGIDEALKINQKAYDYYLKSADKNADK